MWSVLKLEALTLSPRYHVAWIGRTSNNEGGIEKGYFPHLHKILKEIMLLKGAYFDKTNTFY